MAIQLIECNNFTVEGIQELKILTSQTNGQPIEFPLDFTLYNNDDGIISIEENKILQTVTIGEQVMDYLIVRSFDMCEFEDEYQNTRQGKWYRKSISLIIPKPQLYTHNQLVDFLFNVDGKYAVANCVVLIKDSLGQQFIIGYDAPCVLNTMEISTDAYASTENKYMLEFVSKSYSRLRRFVTI